MAMFPIRCLVETVSNGHCPQCSLSGNVVADSYAIVAGQTPLNQLVDTVLTALGLQELSFGAKGTIQLKNWKPLTFDQIVDDPDVDIESVLKDVSNHLTLRILTKQSDVAVNDCVRDLKDRLLKMLVQKSPNILADLAQPQLKDFILQIVQGESAQTTSATLDAQDMHLLNSWLNDWSKKKNATSTLDDGISANNPPNPQAPSSAAGASSSTTSAANPMPPATRFSQLLEVPKLERWFKESPNPSRQKLLHYMHILNGSNFRKHTTKISYQQICNWFSNARASHRKRQMKGGSLTNGNVANKGAVVGWPNKVFGNQVRGLSLAFNDFIQSTTLNNQTAHDSAMSPIQETAATLQGNFSSDGQSPSASSGDASFSIKVEPFGDDALALPVENESKINGGDATDGTARSSGSSPTLAAISAKHNGNGLASSGPSPNVSLTGVARPSALQSSYAALNPANRTRLMFDPLSELPMLEKYFEDNPHPSWVQIDQITEVLNGMLYRQTYPPVSSHNVKICKPSVEFRMSSAGGANSHANSNNGTKRSSRRQKVESSSSEYETNDGAGGSNFEPGSWECTVCTFRNKSEAFRCEMCDVRKGTSTRKPRLNSTVVEQQQTVAKFVQQQQLAMMAQVQKCREKPFNHSNASLLDIDSPGPSHRSLESPTSCASTLGPGSPCCASKTPTPQPPEAKTPPLPAPTPSPTISITATTTSCVFTPKKKPRNGESTSRGASTSRSRCAKNFFLKNLDQNSARTLAVTVNGVTVVITDYKLLNAQKATKAGGKAKKTFTPPRADDDTSRSQTSLPFDDGTTADVDSPSQVKQTHKKKSSPKKPKKKSRDDEESKQSAASAPSRIASSSSDDGDGGESNERRKKSKTNRKCENGSFIKPVIRDSDGGET